MRKKFPRILKPKQPAKPKKTVGPCRNCGKGLGTCNGGWCPRCVTEWLDQTAPTDVLRSPSEMLGRTGIRGGSYKSLTGDN